MRFLPFGFMAFFLMLLTGCGTMFNLYDCPKGTMFCGTGSCYPFGGVTRSGFLAIAGPPIGVCGVIQGNIAIAKGDFGEGFESVGMGILVASAGLVAIVDTPVSLAGDILTLPVVHARCNEHPWATWWGKPSQGLQPSPEMLTVEEHDGRAIEDTQPTTTNPGVKSE